MKKGKEIDFEGLVVLYHVKRILVKQIKEIDLLINDINKDIVYKEDRQKRKDANNIQCR